MEKREKKIIRLLAQHLDGKLDTGTGAGYCLKIFRIFHRKIRKDRKAGEFFMTYVCAAILN